MGREKIERTLLYMASCYMAFGPMDILELTEDDMLVFGNLMRHPHVRASLGGEFKTQVIPGMRYGCYWNGDDQPIPCVDDASKCPSTPRNCRFYRPWPRQYRGGTVAIPWGAWDIETGLWFANEKLDITAEAQHYANMANGFSCEHRHMPTKCPMCAAKRKQEGR